MGRTVVKYMFGLAALVVVVDRASKGGTLIREGAAGIARVQRALSARD